jgi:hypothetical protein
VLLGNLFTVFDVLIASITLNAILLSHFGSNTKLFNFSLFAELFVLLIPAEIAFRVIYTLRSAHLSALWSRGFLFLFSVVCAFSLAALHCNSDYGYNDGTFDNAGYKNKVNL